MLQVFLIVQIILVLLGIRLLQVYKPTKYDSIMLMVVDVVCGIAAFAVLHVCMTCH